MTNFLVQILGVALSLATSKIVLLVAVGLLCLKLYLVHSKGVCRSTQTLEGKTVIVTGGNAGIGKETAKELARRKARVILACRNLEKADKAMQEIFEETQQKVVIKRLDLASLRSVREFAEDILKTESRLDVLVNNAGLINDRSKVQLTEDGYEVCFQTNYLGHFLLTILLSELLKKSAPSRVINLSSILHHIGSTANLHDKATGNHPWTHPVLVYSNTKMAMLVFSRALAAKLKPHVKTCQPGANMMSRKTVADRVNQMYEDMKKRLRAHLRDVVAICCTADCWTSFRRSFLGVTAHWLGQDCARKSAVLACMRLTGHHTYDVLASALHGVFTDYEILNKVTATVADNASNFSKAFRMFGHQETNEEEKDHEVVDLYQVLQAPLDLDTPPDEDEVRLPRHERCAALMLNLVATADAEQALEDARYKRIFSRVLTVCKALWTKQQHSSIASEVVKRHLRRFLLVPCSTRWNSLYKALDQISQQGSNINKLLDALNISRILGDDLIFLQEYTSVCSI
ncbi:retinol dehydrogenase 11-like [Ixodes scapularis]